MTKKVREVVDLLEQNGWRLVRIRGDLAVGTLKSILKGAGIQL